MTGSLLVTGGSRGIGRATALAAAAAGWSVGVGYRSDDAAAREVVAGLVRGGFDRVCLVNAHLEPAHMAVLRGLPGVVLPRLDRAFVQAYQDRFGRRPQHADAYETSLILAEAPDPTWRPALLIG